MKPRKDIWSESDDTTLANIVIKNIETGSTQLSAFEEAGNKLSRTSAACGFRWNSEVRKRYESRIKQAKQIRLERKNEKGSSKQNDIEEPLFIQSKDPLETFVEYVNSLRQVVNRQERQIRTMTKILNQKEDEIATLKEKLETVMKPEQIVSEDYKQFLEILNNARQLGILEKMNIEKSS